MSSAVFHTFLRNQPENHAPEWHVHGVLGHMINAVAAAIRLQEDTGRDIVQMAILHDVGKLGQFTDALALFSEGKDPAPAYAGHEAISAEIAKIFLPEADCKAIAIHHFAYYLNSPQEIIEYLGTATAVENWMLLCAADAVGKGFTPNQIKQRLQISEKFLAIARLMGIAHSSEVLDTCINAVDDWQPIDIPTFA